MQTSYAALAVGYPGMIADTNTGSRHIVSCVNPSDAIPVGVAVARGTDDDHVKLPTSAAEVTAARGIAVQDWLSEITVSGVQTYPVKSAVGVMRQGRVWVQVEEAVNDGDDVFVRYATGAGGSQKGAFRKSADTATAGALPTAKYVTTASASGLAMVEINMP